MKPSGGILRVRRQKRRRSQRNVATHSNHPPRVGLSLSGNETGRWEKKVTTSRKGQRCVSACKHLNRPAYASSRSAPSHSIGDSH